MTIERKLLSTSPSGDAPNVAEVFSTHVYIANDSTQTINNGIDLAGEGGLVWTKGRFSGNGGSALVDTVRGRTKWIGSDENNVEATATDGIQSFTSTGYTLGSGSSTYRWNNTSNTGQVSWTFRKKKKFFDIVTWTGNATVREIPHALAGPVGMILVKSLNTNSSWSVFHRSAPTCVLDINNTNTGHCGGDAGHMWGNGSSGIAPTNTVFTINAAADMNGNGRTYVAYVFADNSSEDGAEQIIKCGSYTGTGASIGATVNLGWEPQWLLIKPQTANGNWTLLDSIRGLPVDADNTSLNTSTNGMELINANWLEPTSTGFKSLGGNYADGNASGVTYIYMAIRAPMMKEPETATEVFSILRGTGNGTSTVYEYNTGFPVDFAITFDKTGGNRDARTRLMGINRLRTQLAEAQADTGVNPFDSSVGFHKGAQSTNYYTSMWKRAKGFFDVVAWGGAAGNVSTMPHSLGVAPELVILKYRGVSDAWYVYHTATTGNVYLNYASSTAGSTNYMANTTATVFNTSLVSNPANKPIAYLFATLAGISKVGGYTGNDSNNHVIDCGFSNGARWVLIKRLNATGQWYLFDSVRGITVGSTDPFTMLNLTNADQTEAAGMGPDAIQPDSSGFKLTSGSDLNQASKTFLFYAIA